MTMTVTMTVTMTMTVTVTMTVNATLTPTLTVGKQGPGGCASEEEDAHGADKF